jgi:hypothetical protein
VSRDPFPSGAKVYVDGRDIATVRQAFPEGSTSYAFPHYKVDIFGGDRNVTVRWDRVTAAIECPYCHHAYLVAGVCPSCHNRAPNNKPLITMNRADYSAHVRDSDGLCVACGAYTAGGVEPDADSYECEECGEPKVMGFENALIDGWIEVTP